MDENIILKELARKLPETEGISYELQNDKLKVRVGENNEFEVRPSGGITCYPETVYDDKFHEAEILISNTVRDIKEYVDIMQTAPELNAEGIGEGFRKIIDFNNIVLAGRYLNDNDGFQFVTWMYDRTGVCAGHYYNDDFEKAKESFAKRNGFINPNKLFSDKELSEIYRCISDTLYGGFDLDDEQLDILEVIQEKIKDSVDNLFMGAFRNNHLDTVEYLLSESEELTKKEYEEFKSDMRKQELMERMVEQSEQELGMNQTQSM